MPSFGHSGAAFPEWQYTTENDFLAQPLTMPEDGWVTELHVRCQGNSGVPVFRLALYEGSDRVFAGPNQNMGQSEAWRSTTLSRKVSGGADVWIGVWAGTGGTGSMMVRRRDVSSNERRYDSNATSLPASVTGTAEKYRIQVYADYVANAAPLQGSWRPEAPTGTIAGTNPTFSGNTPEAAADAAHDHIAEVHLQVWRASNNAMVYDSLFPTTVTEQSNGYFSRSSGAGTRGASTPRASPPRQPLPRARRRTRRSPPLPLGKSTRWAATRIPPSTPTRTASPRTPRR